jgi:hypothetical protein
VRLDQALDPIPTPTVVFWKYRSDLIHAGGRVAVGSTAPKMDGLIDMELALHVMDGSDDGAQNSRLVGIRAY